MEVGAKIREAGGQTKSWPSGVSGCRACASHFYFYIRGRSIVPLYVCSVSVQTPAPVGLRVLLGLLAWKDLGRESGAESARPGPARASRHGTDPLGPAPRARPEPLGAPCASSLPVSAGPSAGMRRERVYARTEPRAAGLSFLVWAPLRGLRKAFVSVGDSCQYFPH